LTDFAAPREARIFLVRLRWLLAAFVVSMALVSWQPAAAQTKPMPTAVMLTQIKLVTDTSGEAKFDMVFTPKANTFAPVPSDPTNPSVGFALTTRGPLASSPPGMKGLVRNIAFDQEQTVLIMRFTTTAAASISAAQLDDKTIEVTVSSGAALNDVGPEAAGAASGIPPAMEQPESYELVRLKYADVSEVVGLLTDGISVKSNDLFNPQEPAFGSNSLTGGSSYNPGPTTQAPGSSDEPLGQSIDSSMAIDRRLNAVWLRGTPDQIARMKAMIAMIDVPLDSVVLETEFLELNETGAKALGIDFTNSAGQIAVATFQTGQFIPATAFGTGKKVTSIGLQAAIYAQVQSGNGRILSKPRISAQSGSTAKIITGDALPILTSIALSGVNGVSQQVQYVNVGVTLQIAPRVSQDGYVSSHVFAVVSSVTGYQQGYPTISQREAETSATVRDGDSFVIGGLTQEDVINSKTKIPLLGDIPLIGQAFRTNKSATSKTELYIIVTPHIVHHLGAGDSIAQPTVTETQVPITPGQPQ
jgi:general secretion pathway protein D